MNIINFFLCNVFTVHDNLFVEPRLDNHTSLNNLDETQGKKINKQGLRQDSEAATDESILVVYLGFFHKLSPNLSTNLSLKLPPNLS
jgi:hypothetical protein